MFCSKCGNKLPKKSMYCNECGSKILVKNIKKEKNYDDTDNIDDQVHVKKNENFSKCIIGFYKYHKE